MIIAFKELKINRKYARLILRRKDSIKNQYRDLTKPITVTPDKELINGYEAIIRAKAFGLKVLPCIYC